MKPVLGSQEHECGVGEIFVFGSNLAGVHGKGAAATALSLYGAKWGNGAGRQGKAYALPTKDLAIRSLPLDVIEFYATGFIAYAKDHPDTSFFVTRVGCGLAGYRDEQIAPFFRSAPSNCRLPPGWR